jgi:uncharacterized integral membrane protein (TIGR00697 family)
MNNPFDSRAARLFVVLACFLAVNALIAEFVGVKVFALEPTLGLQTLNWNLFGQTGSLSFTSGVLLWPFVFLMTDIINEYFGRRGVRFISWLTVALIVYGFLAAYLAISLAPAEFWLTVNNERGVPDMQAAFSNIFGQGMWTIAGSVTAFLIGQLIDVSVFHRIRMMTDAGRARAEAAVRCPAFRFRPWRSSPHPTRRASPAGGPAARPNRRRGRRGG